MFLLARRWQGVVMAHTHFFVTGSQILLGGQVVGAVVGMVVVPASGQAQTLGLPKVP